MAETVYVREDQILDELDVWLCQIFAPGNLRRTVETLLEARNSEIDRVAIETAERLKADGRLRAINRKKETTEKEIVELIPRLAEMTGVPKEADPADRNDLYTQMGLHLVYEPSERVVVAEARPSMYQSYVSEG